MAALLPLIGGVLLARFAASRTTVVGVELVLYAIAATVLIASAPDHGHSYGSGVILSLVLAPLCVLAVVLGSLWRNRQASIQPAGS
jgi:peptidoglycan/LPS O-acetylase OafA/YrhL